MNAHSPAPSILDSAGVDPQRAGQILGEALKGADDGELFVERSESESFLFDDGRLKSAAYDATEGFGLRVVAGETAGYAHASEISEAAIGRAAQSASLAKRAYRKGVPHTLRAAVWAAASRSDTARKTARPSESYSSLLARPTGPGETRIDHQIDLDLPRTFPAHPWLATPESRGVLRRVLQAVSRSDPAVSPLPPLFFFSLFFRTHFSFFPPSAATARA